MSNGGSLLDSIQGLFSSSDGGRGAGRKGEADPLSARLERVEQIAAGVEMAAAALEDDMSELRRRAEEAAGAVLEAARERTPEDRGGSGEGGEAPRESVEALSRSVDALEELHYRLLRVEVHPGVRSEEERERAAERAREAVADSREAADALAERTAA